MRRLLRAVEVLAWFAFFAFAALVLALRYWVLPDIERYRPGIVAAISQAVGLRLEVGALEAGWRGLRPQLKLTDVRLYDTEGREALALPAVEHVVSWRSLLHLDLRAHSLAIDGPRLSVRRDSEGVLYVAGIALSPDQGGHGFGAWLLAQEDIVVRNAEIEWHDDKRGAPPLALSALSLRLRSAGPRHLLGLTARPGADLGPSLELRAELAGNAPGQAWNGRVYVELGTTELAAWRAWVDYPAHIRRGQGAVRAWLTLAGGRLTQATADLALERVSAQLGPELPPLELAALRGRLQGREISGGYELAARSLALSTGDGPAMQPMDFQLRWTRALAGSEHGALGARLVELEPLAHLAAALPFPEEWRARLAELSPRGRLAEARLEWQGPAAEPQRFSARARFDGLALRPGGAIPGFAGMSGSFEASEQRGRLHLATRDAEIDLPGVFPEPRLELDALSGQIDWELVGTALSVRIASLAFANPDLAGTAFGSWSRAGSGPGRIDLSAQLTRADGRQIARYLPRPEIMRQTTRAWLASGILAGEASDVHLRLRGDLSEFPFRDPAQGEFSVAARISGGELKYAEAWPPIREIRGELLFDRDRMEIVGRSGTIFGARLANVRVSLPRIGGPEPRLSVSGQAEGPASEFLKFIEASPLRASTGGFAAGMSAAGNGRLRLALELPLRDLPKSRVEGDYEFADNRVTLRGDLPALERAAGRIGFTESSLTVHGVQGRLAGGAIAFSGGSRDGGTLQLVAKGEATAAGARAFLDPRWSAQISGGAAYTATVELREGLARLSLESPLRGVASTLPPPLDKAAAETLPLKLELTPLAGGALERITLSLGARLAAEVQRRRQGDALELRRAAIWMTPEPGQPIRLPERPGTLIYGRLEAFDADRWLALDAGGGAARAALDLRFGVLDAYGKRLHNVALRAGAEEAGWSAALASDEMSGDVSFVGRDGGRLFARLAHLTIPADRPGPRPAQARRPRDLPAVDVTAERFVHQGRDLGRLELAAQRVGEDWRVERLLIASPDASFGARGSWFGGAERTAIEFELEAADAGGLLARLGHEGLVRGAKAELRGSLGWNGLPIVLDYASLGGELELHASDGQFLEIDPGIGKLISLISLQALPRRVALDFRDVFSKGFQFDRIDAGAHLQGGVMALRELRMRGSAADVRMSGEVNLARETQALKVRVVPGLGDSASTAVAAIINPVAGVAAAIAQRVLKNPLGQIFAYDYNVTGSWQDPQVERIAKAPAVPEPSFAP